MIHRGTHKRKSSLYTVLKPQSTQLTIEAVQQQKSATALNSDDIFVREEASALNQEFRTLSNIQLGFINGF